MVLGTAPGMREDRRGKPGWLLTPELQRSGMKPQRWVQRQHHGDKALKSLGIT